VPKEDWSV